VKPVEHAHSVGGRPGDDSHVALGPDGKTLAVKVTTTTGTGRQRSVTAEAVVYRLGQDAPVARIRSMPGTTWMEFGKDEDQLVVISIDPEARNPIDFPRVRVIIGKDADAACAAWNLQVHT